MAVQTVFDILSADSTVSSIVTDRITPLIRVQDLPLPAVTLSRVSVVPINLMDRPDGTDDNRVQVDSWDQTYAGVRALASACRSALERAGYPMMSEMDNFDASAELSGYYRVTQEFSMWLST